MSCYANGCSYLRRFVVHQHHVGSLNSSVAAKCSHGNAHIGTLKYRGIVDAVAYKCKILSFGFFHYQPFHLLHLIGRQQLGMVFVQAQTLGNILANGFTVTCQHNGLLHSKFIERGYSLCAILLYLVVDNNVSGIFAVNRNVDYGANKMTLVCLQADVLHHLTIANAHNTSANLCPNASAGYLLHIFNGASVGCLVREGIP